MTIHGAKGLESPFVIVLDANNTKPNPDKMGVLMDWPPQEMGPLHLSAFNTKTLTSPRKEINEAEKAIGLNENWNLFYVAMTRAKQGLWISGDAQKPSPNNPTGLNQESWYGKASEAGLLPYPVPESPIENTQKTPRVHQAEDKTISLDDFVLKWPHAIHHQTKLLNDIEAGITVEVFAGEDEAMAEPDPEVLQEGTNFHKLLEFLTPDSGNQSKPPMPSEQELMNWLSIDQESAKKLLGQVKTVLESSRLQRYLTSGDWIAAWNELDIVTKEGKGKRMDRLVELDDHIAIIDYKLTIPTVGSEKYEKYRKQLQGYQAELARIRPDKPVRTYLISSLGDLVEVKAT
jgi:ATP-dependent helicase/nuclease subunit A